MRPDRRFRRFVARGCRSPPVRVTMPGIAARAAITGRVATRRPLESQAMDASLAPEPSAAPPAPAPFAPVSENQRIEALDVVRGFALLGIFLMNIEWFSRPLASFNEGMPRGLTGADWGASWFIAYFVQGKFWTIFSLLFGMGFAVMLVRAERAGREFTKIYLRRILALAVFGAVHFIYLWEGDILFSYAMGALALLIVLYGRAWPILIGCAALAGLGFLTTPISFSAASAGWRPRGSGAVPARHQAPCLARRLDARGLVPLAAGRGRAVDRRGGALASARRPDPSRACRSRCSARCWSSRAGCRRNPRAGREAEPAHGGRALRLRRRRDDGDGPGHAVHARPAGRPRVGGHASGGRVGEMLQPADRVARILARVDSRFTTSRASSPPAANELETSRTRQFQPVLPAIALGFGAAAVHSARRPRPGPSSAKGARPLAAIEPDRSTSLCPCRRSRW